MGTAQLRHLASCIPHTCSLSFSLSSLGFSPAGLPGGVSVLTPPISPLITAGRLCLALPPGGLCGPGRAQESPKGACRNPLLWVLRREG